jgi:uncharacterized protein (DUF433 family)
MSTEPSPVNSSYVERKPGVRGGRPIICGTRILVSELVQHYKRGLSVEETLLHFPHLTPAGIYGALAYYHEHQAEIGEDEAAWMRRYPHPPHRYMTAIKIYLDAPSPPYQGGGGGFAVAGMGGNYCRCSRAARCGRPRPARLCY